MQNQKPRRRAYLDDFKPDASGNYVYCGKMLAFCGSETDRRRFRRRFGLCCAFMLAAEIAVGCLNPGELDNTMPVLIPYMLQVIFAAAFLWSGVRLVFADDPLRAYLHRQTVQRLPTLAVLLAVCAGATFLSALIVLIVQKSFDGAGIVYLLLQLAVCAAALFGRAHIRRAEWKES